MFLDIHKYVYDKQDASQGRDKLGFDMRDILRATSLAAAQRVFSVIIINVPRNDVSPSDTLHVIAAIAALSAHHPRAKHAAFIPAIRSIAGTPVRTDA